MAVETRDIAAGGGARVVRLYARDAEAVGRHLIAAACAGEGVAQGLPQTDVAAGFPAEPESPGRARRLVAATLRQWGHDDALVDDVALIVSELTTNAVRHARSPFVLAVRVQNAMLRVAVQDETPPAGGFLARPAHGLGLVDALSTRWDVERTPAGKVVWAELPCEPHAPRGGPGRLR
jgi:anti-sigma regulatory factor (Ser/Thr protein kinase)